MINYVQALKWLLPWEGGFGNDPYDPGGATNYGVIQTEYNRHRRAHGLPQQSVRYITMDEVQAIYKSLYWDYCRCDELPAGVDNCVFDYAVNSGTGRAPKVLQRALNALVKAGLKEDGRIGPLTLAALARANPDHVIDYICDERLGFLQRLRTWWRFGKGWRARVVGVRSQSHSLVPQQALPLAA
jgi:lysozyme family protein